MMKIIRAIPKDAKIISYLGRITFKESFGHLFGDQNDLLVYLEKTFSETKIYGSLQKEENVYWIAYWNDLPVGYAKLKLHSPSKFIDSVNTCQLQKIYVLKDYLSMKIGHQLQEILLQDAQLKGFETIWLSVWVGNDRAIKFYQRNHFQSVGNHLFSIGKENFEFLVMNRELNK